MLKIECKDETVIKSLFSEIGLPVLLQITKAPVKQHKSTFHFPRDFSSCVDEMEPGSRQRLININ